MEAARTPVRAVSACNIFYKILQIRQAATVEIKVAVNTHIIGIASFLTFNPAK